MTVIGFTAALVMAVTLASPVAPAQAAKYPSWQDLQNAKSNTSAARAQVAEIRSLIAGLQTQVAETRAASDARAAELEVAQDDLDEATRRAESLQAQADESKKTADAATRQAGQLAAQLYRTGGTDLSVNLFLEGEASGKGADELLSKLGSMSKLVERSADIYDQAQTAKNTAQALGDQAKVAKAEREKLRRAAEDALVAAQAAADAAAGALAESEDKGVELAAQLTFMQDTEAKTAEGYRAGVAERKRLAAIEAARVAAARAAAAAAAAAAGGGGGSSGGGGGGGDWVSPAYGRITAGYGPRPRICSSGGCSSSYHSGTDLATGCYAPISAAHSGRVVYAGRLGTYGNYVLIDHGGGVSTGYAHIRDGGIFVRNGQRVGTGQAIASTGSTGASTACHLHFEVRVNGGRINPVPFMGARGAWLG
ncbi:cell wall-binding protein [Cryobacterium sp. Sr8]|nr:cell wall-binding protein [Cryobacterium sp. Sr8]